MSTTDDASLTFAPSCTVEDAALYLMGFPQSHLQLLWWKSSDDPLGGEWLSIESYQHLAEEWDAAKFELEEAKKYQASENKNAGELAELTDRANQNAKNVGENIASRLIELNILATQKTNNLNQATIDKQAELVQFTEQYKLARSYRTAIINELAKGAASSLHIDSVATPNVRNPYITLLSLKIWAHKSLKISILNELDTVKPVKPLPKMRQQEKVILDEINRLDHDPKKLPKNPDGKPGVKAEVRKLVQHPPLFDNTDIFDKAWQRLLDSKDIISMK